EYLELVLLPGDRAKELVARRVHRGKGGPYISQASHGPPHSFRNVEKLEVHEDFLFFALYQFLYQVEVAPSHEELQAELVELDGVAEFVDHAIGFALARDIEREDQPLPSWDGFCRKVGVFHREWAPW